MEKSTKIVLGVVAIVIALILFSQTKKSELVGAAPINKFKSVNVLATSTIAGNGVIVLPANAGRVYAVITNTGGTIAYLGFNSTTTPSGLNDTYYPIALTANGGSYTINLDNLYYGQIIATSSAVVSIRTLEAL